MSEQRRGGAWTKAARNDEVACGRPEEVPHPDGRVVPPSAISAAPERIEDMSEQPLGAGVVHRLRRPGRVGAPEVRYPPGDLGARSVRFAGALIPRPLPHAQPVSTGSGPGRTLAGAIRVEVPAHRLAQVQAAGSMVVPRDLLPLQPRP